MADAILRWDGARWVDVGPDWGLAVSASTHGARFDDIDGDGDLDALRLVNRDLRLLAQEPGPRFVERREPLGNNVMGFVPLDAENDGDTDIFLARSRVPHGDAVASGGFRVELPGDDEDRLAWRAPEGCRRVTVSLAGDLGGRLAGVRVGKEREPVVELDLAQSISPPAFQPSQVAAWFDAPTRTVSVRAQGPAEQLLGSIRCVEGGELVVVAAELEAGEPWSSLPNQLWLNDGAGQFTEAAGALPSLPTPAHLGRPTAADVDLDGDADLLVVTTVTPDAPGNPPDYLLINDGHGRFAVDPGFAADTAPERGLFSVAADLDGDRFPELLVVNSETPGAGRAFAWHNPGGPNRWIEVEVYDSGGKARSLSAWIEVRAGTITQRRRSVPYPDYRANGNLAAVFGLGAASHAEVRVRWPDGAATDWRKVAAGATVSLVHP